MLSTLYYPAEMVEYMVYVLKPMYGVSRTLSAAARVLYPLDFLGLAFDLFPSVFLIAM